MFHPEESPAQISLVLLRVACMAVCRWIAAFSTRALLTDAHDHCLQPSERGERPQLDTSRLTLSPYVGCREMVPACARAHHAWQSTHGMATQCRCLALGRYHAQFVHTSWRTASPSQIFSHHHACNRCMKERQCVQSCNSTNGNAAVAAE